MEFEVINKDGERKVAFFSKRTFGTTLLVRKNVARIAEHNNLEIHLFDTDDHNFLIFGSLAEHEKLNEDDVVTRNYDYILKYIRDNDIKISIFFGSGYPWTSVFLDKLKELSYAACYLGDDPEGAEFTSRYYVKNYDYAFCGGIFFDSVKKIKDKYIEWGAKKSNFIPLGVNPDKYTNQINDYGNRAIDLVYVGGCYFPKIFRMFRLKRHFGNRMKMYGRGWNSSSGKLKTLVLKFIKLIYNIPQINELPEDALVDLYQNTKVGFNMHMSYGPSNLRTYELPMNGVMQICDCEKGLKELYEIDKEVVAYESIGEAINKIEYYLKNDDRRISIAKAGYERARKDYRLEKIFEIILNEINKDINEK